MEYHLSAKFYKSLCLLKENQNEYPSHHPVHWYVLIKPTYIFFFANDIQNKKSKLTRNFHEDFPGGNLHNIKLRNDKPFSFWPQGQTSRQLKEGFQHLLSKLILGQNQ